MPNWVQLLTFTAEYTPGPYHCHAPPERRDGLVFIHATSRRIGERSIGAVLRSHAWMRDNLDGVGTDTDNEQEATGRLWADAPELVALLARWANFGGADGPRLGADRQEYESLLAATETILRRHVRIGCAPVDAESRQPPLPFCIGDETGDGNAARGG